MSSDTDKSIRERAYGIWESEGRPQGRSEQHWEQARAELAGQDDASSSAGKKKSAAGKSRVTQADGQVTKAAPTKRRIARGTKSQVSSDATDQSAA